MQNPHGLEFTGAGPSDEARSSSHNSHAISSRMLDPTLLLAAICTGAFYTIVLQPSMHGSLLHRYTTEHLESRRYG